jgi:hypothetical protein
MKSLLFNLASIVFVAFIAWRQRAQIRADVSALRQYLLREPWTRQKCREILAYSLLGAWVLGILWIASAALTVQISQLD